MIIASEYKVIHGQCGTCKFAKEFGIADCPSGAEDGVHCTSREQAIFNDNCTGGDTEYLKEFDENGYCLYWRLEALVEENYICPQWQQK